MHMPTEHGTRHLSSKSDPMIGPCRACVRLPLGRFIDVATSFDLGAEWSVCMPLAKYDPKKSTAETNNICYREDNQKLAELARPRMQQRDDLQIRQDPKTAHFGRCSPQHISRDGQREGDSRAGAACAAMSGANREAVPPCSASNVQKKVTLHPDGGKTTGTLFVRA